MQYGGHLSLSIYNVIVLIILFPCSFMLSTCIVLDLCMAWQNATSAHDLTKKLKRFFAMVS
jgi:hypothetical protein